MKKLIKFLAVILCLVGSISIYFIFNRPDMSNSTRIICKYFENIQRKQKNENIDAAEVNIDFNNGHIEEEALPLVIDYQNAFFQFSGYSINNEAVYTENSVEENLYDLDGKDMKENVYRLKSTLLKYGFAYKYEDVYYLYYCLDNEFGGDAEDFDELMSGINADDKLSFYGIEIGISTFKKDKCFDKDIVCDGDADKLFDECIIEKNMKNVGLIPNGRITTTSKTNLKTATISIYGYMKDTGIFLNLLIRRDGYLNLYNPGLRIDTCFQISEEQLEMICQYILQNFKVYKQ